MNGNSKRDDSGRDRLFWNVVAGWCAHAVTVVVGFVMPRIIYESVGQAALGVWDIGWSLVIYLAYSGLGTPSAVTHYVARFRAEDSLAGVRIVTATAWWCQFVLAFAVGAVFVGLFSTLYLWLPSLDGFSRADLATIGLLLGAAIFAGHIGATAHGVLAGCHRGSWNEMLAIAADVSLALAMIAVLIAGWGVIGLAAVTCGVRLIVEGLRLTLAALICEGISVRPRYASWQWARNIVVYGTKTSVGILQELLIHQIARLALAASAGPVAVAMFSRYLTLVRQIGRSVERVTQVISPMTSGLVGLGREHDVQRFSLRASNAAVMLMLPMVVVFGVLGDDIVTLWMGPNFVVPGLSWVFAAMALLHSDRGTTTQILSGLNSHGRISLICLGASLTVLLLSLILLRPLTPLSAGVLVALSTLLGITVPHYLLGCRRLGIGYLEHFLYVYLKPLLSNLIFFAFLMWGRAELHAGDYPMALAAAAAGGAVLGLLYWFVAFDPGLRDKVRRRLWPRWAT